MTTQNYYESVSETIYLSTNNTLNFCRICNHKLESMSNIGEAINHYIGYHHAKLLHVGQESCTDSSGKQISYTVAVLGRST